jgi:Glutathione S-transferase, C-terminal domain
VPDGPESLQYILRHSNRTLRREELEKCCLTEVDGDVLHVEVEEGYAALSVLLGDDIYIFSDRCTLIQVTNRRPGLPDAAVFAYTWTVLDKLGESKFATIIRKFDNLVDQAYSLKKRVYPE